MEGCERMNGGENRGVRSSVGQQGQPGLVPVFLCAQLRACTYVFLCVVRVCPCVFVLPNLGVSSFLRLLC